MLNICMAGVDYTKARVDIREAFAFTQAGRKDALAAIKQSYPDLEAVLIATCNRTELWLAAESEAELHPDEILCALKKVSLQDNKTIFTIRSGTDAVLHLFYLSCGLKSQISGENQILSQVKEAVQEAAEAGSAGLVLRRLFQTALTCAKRVKTETNIMRQDRSAAQVAVDFIKLRKGTMSGLNCLVIGNGVIGRLCAELLGNADCNVTMTLRRHKYNKTVLSSKVFIINYDERYEHINNFDVIISVTVSPHHTITLDELSKHIDSSKRLFIDLAVPRDIDPQINTIDGVELFDIDDISRETTGTDHINNNIETQKIKTIIDDELSQFDNSFSFRANLEIINAIKTNAAHDVMLRLGKEISKLALDEISKEKLQNTISYNVEKVVSKMLFGLRDNLDNELWNECFSALEISSQIDDQERKERA